MRITLALVVLSVSIATFTWARQQPADQRGSNRPVKPESSTQLIELRAALELLELEHEAEKAHLLGRMQRMLELDSMSPTQLAESSELATFFDDAARERDSARDEEKQKKLGAIKTDEDYNKVSERIYREYAEARQRDLEETIKGKVNTAKAYLDRKKADYLRTARTIAEKRLELASAEKRYSDAR